MQGSTRGEPLLAGLLAQIAHVLGTVIVILITSIRWNENFLSCDMRRQ